MDIGMKMKKIPNDFQEDLYSILELLQSDDIEIQKLGFSLFQISKLYSYLLKFPNNRRIYSFESFNSQKEISYRRCIFTFKECLVRKDHTAKIWFIKTIKLYLENNLYLQDVN